MPVSKKCRGFSKMGKKKHGTPWRRLDSMLWFTTLLDRGLVREAVAYLLGRSRHLREDEHERPHQREETNCAISPALVKSSFQNRHAAPATTNHIPLFRPPTVRGSKGFAARRGAAQRSLKLTAAHLDKLLASQAPCGCTCELTRTLRIHLREVLCAPATYDGSRGQMVHQQSAIAFLTLHGNLSERRQNVGSNLPAPQLSIAVALGICHTCGAAAENKGSSSTSLQKRRGKKTNVTMARAPRTRPSLGEGHAGDAQEITVTTLVKSHRRRLVQN